MRTPAAGWSRAPRNDPPRQVVYGTKTESPSRPVSTVERAISSAQWTRSPSRHENPVETDEMRSPLGENIA
jgi:hypothetical protein